MYKRGEIYLADLNPRKGKEVGKLRPVLIFQTDFLNEIEHPTIIVLPLSTKLVDDAYPLRFRLNKRDHLEQDSDILCDQIRAIDTQRIIPKPLTLLTQKELFILEEQVALILGFKDYL
ncbi:type II toxin-antitoxin system PemK/MazF family toxin [Nitratiruptor sp. SB155-2]|uniref:type II toxin-antitoxin system PemK/MazF family toxin n=1 Tax=Nitratiruptor sp. (strain SB155-2) TaxID=387092 RepID=UPI00015870CF|nr:type II toxin-antitoxin system PemK/MazF family toxin [Nitratiruptor sp. SB155-2]BAF70868.1 transcriptional regulator, PemK family [Nitratiruptor sp. SB155-2]